MFSIITNGTRERNINQEEGVANEFHSDDLDVYVLYKDNQRVMIPDELMALNDNFFVKNDYDVMYVKNNYYMIEINHKLKLIRLVKRSTAFDELYTEELNKGSVEAHPTEYAEFYTEIYEFVEELKVRYALENYRNFVREVE